MKLYVQLTVVLCCLGLQTQLFGLPKGTGGGGKAGPAAVTPSPSGTGKSPEPSSSKDPAKPTNQQPTAQKPPVPTEPIKEWATSAQHTNQLSGQMGQQGVNNNQPLNAEYQASLAQTAALKARVDEMAASGKYDTRNYEEAVAAMAIPTQQFNYQAGKNNNSDASSPEPTSPPPTAETEKIPAMTLPTATGANVNATPETPSVPTIPQNEIANTQIPLDDNGRTPASTPPAGNFVDPVTNTPSFVQPVITAPPGATANPGNSLQQLEPTPVGTKTQPDSGSLTKEAPARGLASVPGETEPTEAEIAAAISRKIADDHKKKVLDAKNGKLDDKTKPSLADRLKNSGGSQITTTPDVHTPSPVPVAPPAPTISLKDEVFWFGPQKFGRFLLDAAGLEKQLGLDKPRREPTGVPALTAPSAVDWLQVLMGWMAAGLVVMGAAIAGARRRITAYFGKPSTAKSPDTEDDDSSEHIEPTSETDLREISSHVETAVLEVDTDSNEGGTGVYVIEKSPAGKVVSRAKLAANSVVAANMLKPKDKKDLRIKAGTDRIKYSGNGKFEKTSEPVCILVHVKNNKK